MVQCVNLVVTERGGTVAMLVLLQRRTKYSVYSFARAKKIVFQVFLIVQVLQARTNTVVVVEQLSHTSPRERRPAQ